jgi:hypothetical protein
MGRRYCGTDRDRAHQERAGGCNEGPSDRLVTGHLNFSRFRAWHIASGPMPPAIQDPCQMQKSAKSWRYGAILTTRMARRANQFGEISQPVRFHDGNRRFAGEWSVHNEGWKMIGRLAGAWIVSRMAGSGVKGAILGYGAAALAKRSVPALVAVALGRWAFRKVRRKRRRSPAYPSDSSPAPPSG